MKRQSKPASKKPKTFYVQPIDPFSNDRISEYLESISSVSMHEGKVCADGVSRSLWEIPEHAVSVILANPRLSVCLFKTSPKGIVMLEQEDFESFRRLPQFNGPPARDSLTSKSDLAAAIKLIERLGDSELLSLVALLHGTVVSRMHSKKGGSSNEALMAMIRYLAINKSSG